MNRWKGKLPILLLLTGLSVCSGCKEIENESGTQQMETEEKQVVEKSEHGELVAVLEAEDAKLQGNVKKKVLSDASNDYYVDGFETEKDSCTFSLQIEEEGFYDLVFRTSSDGNHKENHVYVDDEFVGEIATSTKTFENSQIKRVYLAKGAHEVSVTKYWGWINLDNLTVYHANVLSSDFYEVSKELVDPLATESTKKLMKYLTEIYGKQILSGQYCDTGEFGKEMTIISRLTGKKPAVLGLDFIEYTPSRVANGSEGRTTQYAIKFHEDGGIVTFCWHWNAPEKYLTKEWYKGFNTDATNIDLEKIMKGEDQEGYDLLMKDIDAIAQQLLILQENDVPILFRPLHEASGGWFWWGASGKDSYIWLYRLLFEKLTKEYGIHNLIWLWNGQDADWYPGDEYVDIIGEDIYPGEHVYSSQVSKFLEAAEYSTQRKMVVLSENGCVFDPDLAVRDGAMWGFFCTWQSEFVAKNTGIYAYSDQYTEEDMMKKAYNSEYVITLDELPDFSTIE